MYYINKICLISKLIISNNNCIVKVINNSVKYMSNLDLIAVLIGLVCLTSLNIMFDILIQ